MAIPIFKPENLVIYCDPASIAMARADVKDIDSWTSFSCIPALNRSLICFANVKPIATSEAVNVVPVPSGSNSVVLLILPISK